LDDEEIGHIVYVVPPEDSWYGGDMALAIMSNVFIGNPASTSSAFIAKARFHSGSDTTICSVPRMGMVNGGWCVATIVCLKRLSWVLWLENPIDCKSLAIVFIIQLDLSTTETIVGHSGILK
jgi:hypothetical protein